MQRLQDQKQAAENSRKMQVAARVQQEEQADCNAQLLLQVRARLSLTHCSHTVVHRLSAHTIVHGARRPHLEWDTYVVSCSGVFVFCLCIVVHACASVDA